jgi:hypothetical protein
MGVPSTKIVGTMGIAISVSEKFTKGITTGPSSQTSGKPILSTNILLAKPGMI